MNTKEIWSKIRETIEKINAKTRKLILIGAAALIILR